MLETTKIIVLDNSRNFWGKIKSSPILYFFFSSMVFFSIVMFGFLTFFIMRTEADISLFDVFFSIFFIFLLKSSADTHNHFIKSTQITYALSTQVNQKKTIIEAFLAILTIQLSIWFSFSTLYIVTLIFLKININYPLEYIFFSLGIILSTLIGFIISIHFYSAFKIRLAPTLILLGFYWFSDNILFIIFSFPIVLIQFFWTLNHSMESYRFVNRKERTKEVSDVKVRSIILAQFYKEITILWREKLLFSFIFTSISTAILTGYLVLYGTDVLVPESVREFAEEYLPSMFVFLGFYIVVIYLSVFNALNLFLNEEKNIWIIRNAPVKNRKAAFFDFMLYFINSICCLYNNFYRN